jgi:riboflavin synthase
LQSIIIFILSIKHGMGGRTKIDILCLLVAWIGILIRKLTNNPVMW